MARSLNGTSDYLSLASGLPSLPLPLAIGIWLRPATAGAPFVAELTNPISGDLLGCLRWGAASDGRLWSTVLQAGVASEDLHVTPTTPLNTWTHALQVLDAANSRRLYVNGGNKVTGTMTVNPAGITRLEVGRHYNHGTPNSYFQGDLAHLAIWSGTVPTDAQAAALFAGTNPQDIPGLVAYWKLDGSGAQEVDLIGGRILTVVSAGVASSCPTVNAPAGAGVTGSAKPVIAVAGQSNLLQLPAALAEFATVINAGIQGATAIDQWAEGAPLDPIPLIGSTAIDAFVFGQGESDATAALCPLWVAAARALFARVRAHVGRPSLPVLILSVIGPRTPTDPYLELIRAAQRDVACDPYNRYLDTSMFRHIPAGTPANMPDSLGGEHLYLDAQPQQAAVIAAMARW